MVGMEHVLGQVTVKESKNVLIFHEKGAWQKQRRQFHKFHQHFSLEIGFNCVRNHLGTLAPGTR